MPVKQKSQHNHVSIAFHVIKNKELAKAVPPFQRQIITHFLYKIAEKGKNNVYE
jgi:hypothetical protein